MELLESTQYLDSFLNFETISDWPDSAFFRLDRVYCLLELLGNPQKELKCIHVAGTKGKGSICVFVAHIVQSSGYKVGLYTSPHLYDVCERIRILDGRQPRGETDHFSGKITKEDFYKLLNDIRPSIEKVQRDSAVGPLTYFEIMTVLALCYFKKKRVDFVVLETGLGGRLDATNVVDSVLCGIGPISLEHTRQLGPTINEIAEEKAAIIKPGCSIVISAEQQTSVVQIIKQCAKKVEADALFVGENISCTTIKHDESGQVFNVKGLLGNYKDLKTRLLGEHQVANASVAVGITESLQKLGFDIKDGAIQKGIKDTIWPGRFEIIKKDPIVIVDGAQNAESSRAVAKTLSQTFSDKKVTLVLGISRDKDKAGICSELNAIADTVIFTRSQHSRAYDFSQDDMKILFADKKIINTNTVTQALKNALEKTSPEDIVLVTGSLFVVAEARLCINHD